MAITVIEEGIMPEDIRYEATCTFCHTRVSFTGADGKVTSDQRDGSYISVPCPKCQRSISAALRSPTDELNRRRRESRTDSVGSTQWDR